jgi:hypothetical protein
MRIDAGYDGFKTRENGLEKVLRIGGNLDFPHETRIPQKHNVGVRAADIQSDNHALIQVLVERLGIAAASVCPLAFRNGNFPPFHCRG